MIVWGFLFWLRIVPFVCLAGGVLFFVVFVHVGDGLVCVAGVDSLEFLMSCSSWLGSVFAEMVVSHSVGSRKQCGSFFCRWR